MQQYQLILKIFNDMKLTLKKDVIYAQKEAQSRIKATSMPVQYDVCHYVLNIACQKCSCAVLISAI
jgi:hypothetical protein